MCVLCVWECMVLPLCGYQWRDAFVPLQFAFLLLAYTCAQKLLAFSALFVCLSLCASYSCFSLPLSTSLFSVLVWLTTIVRSSW